MQSDEQDNTNEAPKPKRSRGRPSTQEVHKIEVNISEATARHLEALHAYATKKVVELGFPATVDAAKMLDMWVETMVTEKFKEIGKK